jgi:sec-independent protein translocase protein TatB
MVISPPIQAANLGIADSLILMVLALVVFGPRRLPEIGRKVGKLMYEFRKASNDFKFQMEEELRASEEAERRKALEAQQAEDHKRLLALEAAVKQSGEEAEPVPAAADAGAAESTQSNESPGIESQSNDSPGNQAPIIQPPSTGAPVEAARPGTMADAANAIADDAIDSALNPLASHPDAQEPEIHHG